jgi:hypothetical protein
MFRSNNIRTELTRMIRIELGQINEMSSTEIGLYIIQITQTPICEDKNYCNELIKIWLNKGYSIEKK